VEPNGKDIGLNVRKKAETVLAIIDDREKLQLVREKAAATRDK
jgi:epsin